MNRVLDRSKLYDEVAQILEEDGLHPDRAKLYRVLSRYDVDEIYRVMDAFTRFGVNSILEGAIYL